MVAAFQVAGFVMATRTAVMDLMSHKLAIIRLQLWPLQAHPVTALQAVDLMNINATIAFVFIDGMYVMVLMTVGTTQTNGIVVCIDCRVCHFKRRQRKFGNTTRSIL